MRVIERKKLEGAERYEFSDGSSCYVTRHGWLVDLLGKSIPHPQVDAMMEAIVRYDRSLSAADSMVRW